MSLHVNMVTVTVTIQSQMVCLLPDGIFNHVIFNLNYLFVKFNARPH